MIAFCLLRQEILHAQSVPREIKISIFDGQTMRLLPCRIHLKDSAGLPVFGEGLPGWRDHFVCGGKVALHL